MLKHIAVILPHRLGQPAQLVNEVDALISRFENLPHPQMWLLYPVALELGAPFALI